MLRRIAMLIGGLVWLLAGCTGGGGDNSVATPNTSPIQWDRSPTTVVFRAEIRGGQYENTFQARNEVPPCTIYGDNRVVWTIETAGATRQVLYDIVSDEQIQSFVNYLAIEERIYEYTSGLDSALPSSTNPVAETLRLNVNGRDFYSDIFGGWNIEYYQRIITACGLISIAPVLFEPDAGWLSAQAVPYASDAPLVVWTPSAAGISFGELAPNNERRWVQGTLARQIWNVLLTAPANLRFDEGDAQYFVALEVPGVTRDAPPAP
ncbi:MAG: hypothetical protein HXY40_02370 [Chloroflexi bacterium]|nr:hypothetical protein [Chloroflexota bacterium]